MIDEFERRVIIVAPCIFNLATVACGYYNKKSFEIRKELIEDLLELCVKYGVSLDSYTCPEFQAFGLPRPTSSKSFYEKKKEVFEEVARNLINKIKNYEKNGIRVIAIVGIEGSPSCGVFYTKLGESWTDEELEFFKKNYKVRSKITLEYHNNPKLIHKASGKGLFIEVLEKLLKENNLNIPILGFMYTKKEEFLKNIEKLIDQSGRGA